LLGRINAALEIKKESIAQLQSLINGVTAQVQVLLAKIKSLKDEQAGLNLQGLKDQLEALKIKLQGLYNDYNTCTNSTKDLQDELVKLQQEKKELEERINDLKNQLDKLNKKEEAEIKPDDYIIHDTVEGIVEAFGVLQEDIEREKRWFSSKWARQEKEIRKVIDHTHGMYGDLQGIAGKSLQEIEGLDIAMLEASDDCVQQVL